MTVSGDDQIEVPGSNFDVTITDTNSPVEVGEELEVTAEVENTGDLEDTQDVEFRFDGDLQETQSITLGEGDSQTVTFEFDTDGVAPGDYDTEVQTDDSSDTADVTIEEVPEEAEYTLSNLDPADATVTESDDPIDISADVENVGDETGEQDIELSITDDSGSVVYSDTVEDVELDGGNSTTVTFEDAPAGDLAPGEYTHEVSSDDDSTAGSLTVEEAPDEAFFGVTITATNSPVVVGGELTVTAEVENTGDIQDAQNIEFSFDGSLEDTESISLDGGDSETVSFNFDTTDIVPGDYTVTVASDDESDAADVTVDEAPEEADFQLSNLDPTDATVTEGDDPIDISADVENVGDETGQQDLELSITDDSDSVVYSDTVEDVELDGGDSTTVTFEDAPAGDLAPGEYTHEVASEDDSIAGSLTVEEVPDEAFFEVTITDTNSPVVAGETLEVTADIENTGDEEATQDIELDAGALGSDAASVTLDGGESTSVTLGVETEGGDAGDYTATVASDDDSDTADVTVDEAPEEAEYTLSNLDPADATVTEGDDPIDISADVENVGDETGEQDIELTITDNSDSVVYSDTVEDVALDGGDSTTVTFEDAPAGDLAPGEYTHEIASADDSVAGSLTVEEEEQPDEAEFDVSNLDPADATVTEGDDPIDISADVENVGDETGEQDIELSITNESGSVVYSDTVEDVDLDGGDSTTVTFEDAPAGDLAPGEYTHEVASEDDSIAGSLTVEEAPEEADFQLSNLDPADATVTEGDDPIDISADVDNVGDETGEQDLKLTIADDSGSVVYSDTVEDVELDGGDSETVMFEDAPAGELAPGEYTHEVSSADDSVAGSLTVEEEEQPDEAEFDVSNLDPADATVTEGDDPIDISADIENVGDETGQQDIELTITDDSDSVVYSDTVEDVELDGGGSTTVTFEDAPAGDLAPGEYTHEISSADDSVAGSLTVEKEDDESETSAEFSLDEISQAKYGLNFEELSEETMGQVQEIFDRQPFPEGTHPSDIRTREEIADDRYGEDLSELSDETRAEIDADYKAQFTDDDQDDESETSAEFSLDEISQAKYGLNFEELSEETMGQVQEIFDRQPFPEGTHPSDIRTREEIADDRYGEDLSELSDETRAEIDADYKAQFTDTETE
ncbi:CARDB domain-containing protein [Halovenus amylolytica]|uniref:CARDB domain-containing protein n=1 Tax=Halovenus amylolytica TaxID=2500550 RepID=UPI003D6A8C91